MPAESGEVVFTNVYISLYFPLLPLYMLFFRYSNPLILDPGIFAFDVELEEYE